MEIVEVGIHHRHILTAAPHDSTGGFVLRGAMKPAAVHDDVVGDAAFFVYNQVVNNTAGRCSGYFQAEQAVVVCTVSQHDRTAAHAIEYQLGQHVLGR